jgi:hypothetical protein
MINISINVNLQLNCIPLSWGGAARNNPELFVQVGVDGHTHVCRQSYTCVKTVILAGVDELYRSV